MQLTSVFSAGAMLSVGYSWNYRSILQSLTFAVIDYHVTVNHYNKTLTFGGGTIRGFKVR